MTKRQQFEAIQTQKVIMDHAKEQMKIIEQSDIGWGNWNSWSDIHDDAGMKIWKIEHPAIPPGNWH